MGLSPWFVGKIEIGKHFFKIFKKLINLFEREKALGEGQRETESPADSLPRAEPDAELDLTTPKS